jgi:hypothetical protein
VERTPDKRAVYHETSIVISRAELRHHDVDIVAVGDEDGELCGGKEGFVGKAVGRSEGGESEAVGVLPLEGTREEVPPGFELVGHFADEHEATAVALAEGDFFVGGYKAC